MAMRSLLLAAILAVSLPLPLAGQRYLGTVHQQLDIFSTVMSSDGYQLDGRALHPHSLTGVLPRDGSVGIFLELTAGRSYRVMAACDEDCEDLDLQLYGPDDIQTPLTQDLAEDDVPVVEWSPSRSGEYLLHVTMPRCGTELCYFGLRVVVR